METDQRLQNRLEVYQNYALTLTHLRSAEETLASIHPRLADEIDGDNYERFDRVLQAIVDGIEDLVACVPGLAARGIAEKPPQENGG